MDSSDLNTVIQRLDQYHGIVGKDKYFNSAVIIPLVLFADEYHLLFEKRSNSIRQGGEVSFPGGEFDTDKDENFHETAIRETVEEIGIGKEKIHTIGSLGTLVAPMGVTVDSFVATLEITNLKQLKIDKNEVERIFTIPVSYFIKTKPSEYFVRMEVHTKYFNKQGELIEMLPVEKLKLPGRYSKPWSGRKHRILVYESEEEIIWGITAELVYEFCKLVV